MTVNLAITRRHYAAQHPGADVVGVAHAPPSPPPLVPALAEFVPPPVELVAAHAAARWCAARMMQSV